METTVQSDTVVEVDIKMRLSQVDYDRVVATKQSFDRVAAYLVEQYSKGGVLLKPTHVHYLEQLSGHPIQTAEGVLQAFENANKRGSAAGYLRVTYDVDPAFAEPLEQLATAQGRTVDEIMTEASQIVLTNGWLYAFDIDRLGGGTILFTKQSREEMEELVGEKPLTTTAILKWARSIKKPEPKPAKIGKVKAEVLARLDATEAVV
jgi:hypothetical protein